MNKINITMAEREALIEEIHANAVAKGFWADDHSEDHYQMLVITELSEAVEADRKGRGADLRYRVVQSCKADQMWGKVF